MSSALRWYAIYTRSRYEKRAHDWLQEYGVEVYLPLVKRWRIWSDRKKQVDMPLLPSYLFVKSQPGKPQQYFNILNTPGVVRFITFEGMPAAIPESQINALKRLNSEGIDMEYMAECPPPGSLVKVVHGPMKGFTGEVVTIGNNKKLVLRLDTLDKCVSLQIPLAMVEAVKEG